MIVPHSDVEERSDIRYSTRKCFFIVDKNFSYFGVAAIWVFSFCEGYENTEPALRPEEV